MPHAACMRLHIFYFLLVMVLLLLVLVQVHVRILSHHIFHVVITGTGTVLYDRHQQVFILRQATTSTGSTHNVGKGTSNH
jgi:hypothetical protein